VEVPPELPVPAVVEVLAAELDDEPPPHADKPHINKSMDAAMAGVACRCRRAVRANARCVMGIFLECQKLAWRASTKPGASIAANCVASVDRGRSGKPTRWPSAAFHSAGEGLAAEAAANSRVRIRITPNQRSSK